MSDEHDRLTVIVPQAQVTKALRNILQNEMGVTMDAVREEVERAVLNRIQHMLQEEGIQKIVRDTLSAHLRKSSWQGDPLVELVKNAAAAEMQKFIASNIKIERVT